MSWFVRKVILKHNSIMYNKISLSFPPFINFDVQVTAEIVDVLGIMFH